MPAESPFRSQRPMIAAVLVLAIVAAIVVGWLVFRDDGSSSPTNGPVVAARIAPVALNVSGLRTLLGSVKQPVYWIGPKQNVLYELTRTTNGNVYIRYLPADVKAGAEEGKHLIVATYPFPGAFEALKKVAGARAVDVPGGGIASVSANRKSVNIAYPTVAYQLEVFDPKPGRALEIATAGQLRPVK
jgi:hypothetical protein